ncbi:MAG: polysaccharide deacetylase family protein [Candidatus Omnitrophica bacterium]|nr:polysaccharide deacetylase family protein [Candidatus Omnitrophota bacterium]
MFKHKKLIIICAAVFIGAAGIGIFISRQYVLPIAMYHSVQPSVPDGNRLIVSTGAFERQMKFLKRNKYNVISLTEAAGLIAGKKKIPAGTLVLTFDDGNLDNYTYAFPILKKYGLKATIFLIVNDIGKPDKLNWGQIKEMQDSGLIDFGSHSVSHPFLECITDPAVLLQEILGSKQALEMSLKKPVLSFSYPCGRLNQEVRQKVVDSGYMAAVVTNPGKSFASDDVFALKRLRISENAGNLFIFWFETTGYYNFLRENRHK